MSLWNLITEMDLLGGGGAREGGRGGGRGGAILHDKAKKIETK